MLGRVTYQKLAAYWPTASPEREGDFVEVMNAIPKVVFSKTLQPSEVTWNNTQLNTGDLAHEVGALKHEPGNDIGIVGSAALVQSLIRHGLLDRLSLQVHPVALGSEGGRAIFDGYDQTDFRLIECQRLDSQVIILDYEPKKLMVTCTENLQR